MHEADIQDVLRYRPLDDIAAEIAKRLLKEEDHDLYKDHCFILAYELRTFEKDRSEFRGEDFYKAWSGAEEIPCLSWAYLYEEDRDSYESMARDIQDIDVEEWIPVQ